MEKYKIENEDLDENLRDDFLKFNTALKKSFETTKTKVSHVGSIDALLYPHVPYITPSLLKIQKRFIKLYHERNARLQKIETIRESSTEHSERFVSLELIKMQNKLVKLVLKLVHILHTMLQLQYFLDFHRSNQIHNFLLIFSDYIHYTFSTHQEILLYDEIKKVESYFNDVNVLRDAVKKYRIEKN